MAKREKKSLASMIGQREINPTEIEKAATELHNKPEVKKQPSTKPHSDA